MNIEITLVPAKQVYEAPELSTLGKLEDVTQGVTGPTGTDASSAST